MKRDLQHSKVIEAMKELQGWRFVLLWLWLMCLAAVPVAVAWILH
jgi:hypothetical protein